NGPASGTGGSVPSAGPAATQSNAPQDTDPKVKAEDLPDQIEIGCADTGGIRIPWWQRHELIAPLLSVGDDDEHDLAERVLEYRYRIGKALAQAKRGETAELAAIHFGTAKTLAKPFIKAIEELRVHGFGNVQRVTRVHVIRGAI